MGQATKVHHSEEEVAADMERIKIEDKEKAEAQAKEDEENRKKVCVRPHLMEDFALEYREKTKRRHKPRTRPRRRIRRCESGARIDLCVSVLMWCRCAAHSILPDALYLDSGLQRRRFNRGSKCANSSVDFLRDFSSGMCLL